MHRSLLIVTCVGMLGFLAPALRAQRELLSLTGEDSSFGGHSRIYDDLDGDGQADVLAIVDSGFEDGARVQILSGRDGEALREHQQDENHSVFGMEVLGDLNGDGLAEYAFRVLQLYVDETEIQVYDGATGALIHRFERRRTSTSYGVVMRSRDLDGDDQAELVISTPGAQIGGPFRPGIVEVYATPTMELRYTVIGHYHDSRFGSSVAVIPDVDGDGLDDLVIAAIDDPSLGQRGTIRLVRGIDGTTIRSRAADVEHVARIGDSDFDGYGDYVVTDSFATSLDGRDRSGRVIGYSGRDDSVLFVLYGIGKEELGRNVRSVRDLNGDGAEDLILRTELGAASHLIGMSGLTGAQLFRYSRFGVPYSSADGGRDFDGDGLPDIVYSEPGGLTVLAGQCSIVRFRGEGCPGKGGFRPTLTVQGCAEVGKDVLLEMARGRGLSPAAVLLGTQPAEVPWQGCQLLVAPPFQQIPLVLFGMPGDAGGGIGNALVSIPGWPELAGLRIQLQGLVFDIESDRGLALTRGVEVTLQ